MQDESDKLIVVERGDLVFCFNFHPVKSYNDYRIGCLLPGSYKVGSPQTCCHRRISVRTAAVHHNLQDMKMKAGSRVEGNITLV